MMGIFNRPFESEKAHFTAFLVPLILEHWKNRREVADCYPENTNGRMVGCKCMVDNFGFFPPESNIHIQLKLEKF